ncbi:MAG TPA: peptide ligase PGM1-related protein, partial [Nocardioides sp.]|uniref:peptide ligase PGM1-related protein n=1 Tax=Nocardioides sp. TaxID=35761 RepID=UPI002CE1246D
GQPDEADRVRDRVLAMSPEGDWTSVGEYLAAFADSGGIVEERVSGTVVTSPSVQMRVLPDGSVELLSTHDQLLGGAGGQSYLGCVFPADPAYATLIAEPAMRIGRHLADLGVLGRFAVDFVTVRDEAGHWSAYAIELNLRKGGTTHPFLTLQFLTDGEYDAASGLFRTPLGGTKHLVATDHLSDQRLSVLRPEDVFDLVALHRLQFDQARQTGVVLHMISCLTECGVVGLTAVGDSAEQAWALYQQAQELLLGEAERAAVALPMPAVGLTP